MRRISSDTWTCYFLYIFFFLDSFNPLEAALFVVNRDTGVLKLNSSLDREQVDELSICIKVANNQQGLITNPNSVNYTLIVNVTVNDVNDNAPKFAQKLYAAGITTKDSIGKQILRVEVSR